MSKRSQMTVMTTLDKSDNLGKSFLDRNFVRERWNFITLANNVDSSVTKILRKEESSLPFCYNYLLNYAMYYAKIFNVCNL